MKNPSYDTNLSKFTANVEKMKVASSLNPETEQLRSMVLTKIRTQWKTVRKAFMDLNTDKNIGICTEELKYQLKFWGMNFSDEQFDELFNSMDLDNDGMISYTDLVLSIGQEIHPAEGLYFR